MKQTEQLVTETGIEQLGRVPWGMHACIFYRTKQDLINVLVPYFKAGLENNEFCMWVTSEPLSKKEAETAIRKAVPDFDKYLRNGQIEMLSHSQWYLKRGSFDKGAVLKGWMGKLNQALANGYGGMRITGNTTWLDQSLWKSFLDYEYKINEAVDRCQMIAVCTYCLDGCGPAEIVDVVNTHQLALIEKEAGWVLIKNAERKRAQERARAYQMQLKSLSLQLTLVEERERRRMAEKLQSQTAQSLVISKSKLEALRKSAASTKLAKELEEICNSLGESIAETRSLTSDLSSPVLYELGFETAVADWLDEEIRQQYDTKVEFEDDEQPKPLDNDVRVLLFHNARELLINVVKHALAQNVKVSVHKAGNQIEVKVEDDGWGFDAKKVADSGPAKGAFGLFGIRERLEQLGGHLEIKSAPGHGCRVTMRAPLRKTDVTNGR